MFWLGISAIAAILGSLLVQFGFIPPPHATVLIRVKGEKVWVTRGRLKPQAHEFASDIIREAAVTKGYIAVTGRRVFFSWAIPRSIHQRLRNVLLNF